MQKCYKIFKHPAFFYGYQALKLVEAKFEIMENQVRKND